MEPQIVQKPEMILVGIPFFGSPEGGTFAKTWDRLFKHIADIPARAEEGSELDLYIPIKARGT